MKKLFLSLLIFGSACSGNPENKIAETEKKSFRDSIMDRASEFRKARELKLSYIPSDSMLTLGENLQSYFRFVIADQYIVLELDVDTSFATGNPHLADTEYDPLVVTKNVRMEKISDSLKAFVGKKFHMVGKDGTGFDATIVNLKFMIAYYSHGDYAMSDPADGTADTAKFAQTVWQEAYNWRGMIVGEIDTVLKLTPETHIIGAVPAENTVPVFFTSSENPQIKMQVNNDIRLTAQFELIQKTFLESDSAIDRAASWRTDAYESFLYCRPDAATCFYTQTLTAGDYCGSPFYAELTSAWEMRDQLKQRLLFCFPGYIHADAILDLEGDGIPEFYARDDGGCPMLFKKTAGGWTRVMYMPLMDMRCPC